MTPAARRAPFTWFVDAGIDFRTIPVRDDRAIARAVVPFRVMPARSPSKLGLTLTFCLLAGLLVWRFAVPRASPWLDVAALAAVAVLLLALRTFLKKRS